MENKNQLELEKWSKNILYDWVLIPNNKDYLSLLLTILNYEDEEPNRSNFEEIRKKCESFLAITEDPISDENITQISIIYYGEISSEELYLTINKVNNYINENIENIDLNENVILTIFSSNEIKESKRKSLLRTLQNNDTKIDDIRSIMFSNMEKTFQNNKIKKGFVSEFKFKLDKPNNVLHFNSETVMSSVVNVSAQSIKAVYREYGKNCGPLYGNNLRYHITNKKIDADIKDSIQNNNGNFWFKNNGIVAICDDMEINGNELTIKNFSFINGGQTSYMLGETEFDSNFYILLKIISTKNIDKDIKFKFIGDIAEATNKQKPIKEVDLKANSEETKKLENIFYNLKPFIHLNSRRGSKIPKELIKKDEKWRTLTLLEVGQLGLGSILLSPGSSKNKISTMWSDENSKILFDTIYAKTYSNLRKIWCSIEQVINERKKYIKSKDKGNPNLPYYSTGQWFIFTSILVTQLIRKNNNFKELIRKETEFNNWLSEIRFFLVEELKKEDSFELKNSNILGNLEDLIPEIISDFIVPTFINSSYCIDGGIFSNYTKSDIHFQDIAKKIASDYDKKAEFKKELQNPLNDLFK